MRASNVLCALVIAGCGSFGANEASTDAGPSIDSGADKLDAATEGSTPGADAGLTCAPPSFCEDFSAFTLPIVDGPWKLVLKGGGSATSGITSAANPPPPPSFAFSVPGPGGAAYLSRKVKVRKSLHCELDALVSSWVGSAHYFGVTFDAAPGPAVNGITQWFSWVGKQNGKVALQYLVKLETGSTHESNPTASAPQTKPWLHVVYDLAIGDADGLVVDVATVGQLKASNGAPPLNAPLEFELWVGIFDTGAADPETLTIDNLVCVPN